MSDTTGPLATTALAEYARGRDGQWQAYADPTDWVCDGCGAKCHGAWWCMNRYHPDQSLRAVLCDVCNQARLNATPDQGAKEVVPDKETIFVHRCWQCDHALQTGETWWKVPIDGEKVDLCDKCHQDYVATGRWMKTGHNADAGTVEKQDQVNHPLYYCVGGIECIDVIEAWGLGFHLGNALKYIARAGRKEGASEVVDLEKAAWYLAREIRRREGAK